MTPVSGDIKQMQLEAEHLASAAIAAGGRIRGLTDQAVVENIIQWYFRTLPAAGRRHLVDVGAAYGGVAEVFLKDGWTADLFDPDPECQQRFLLRVVASYGPAVRLFPFAVSDQDRNTVPFHQNAVAGLSGLAPSPFGTTSQVLTVRSVRLDTFLAANNTTRVDFLKIDTEGNDFTVLETFDFERLSPLLVFVEYAYFFPGQDRTVVQAAIDNMRVRGYAAVIFEYDDDGNFKRGDFDHRLIAIHTDGSTAPARPKAFGNVLFYRSGDVHFFEVLMRIIRFLT